MVWLPVLTKKLKGTASQYYNRGQPVLLQGHGGLVVSVLDSGASALSSSPGRGHCVVFLGKILHSHSASLHPGV